MVSHRSLSLSSLNLFLFFCSDWIILKFLSSNSLSLSSVWPFCYWCCLLHFSFPLLYFYLHNFSSILLYDFYLSVKLILFMYFLLPLLNSLSVFSGSQLSFFKIAILNFLLSKLQTSMTWHWLLGDYLILGWCHVTLILHVSWSFELLSLHWK